MTDPKRDMLDDLRKELKMTKPEFDKAIKEILNITLDGVYESARYGCETWALRLTDREVARERFITPLYFAFCEDNKDKIESLSDYEKAHYGKRFDDARRIHKNVWPWILTEIRGFASEVIERASKYSDISEERKKFIIMNAKILIKQINEIEQSAKEYKQKFNYCGK